MITIYHLNMSRSARIIWLMEELGLPYQLEKFQRGPDMLAPATLKQVSPLGKAPVIRDGDLVLIESGAIVEYIINRRGGGRFGVPVSSPDYARYLQWIHFAEGSAMTQFLVHMFLAGGFIPGIDQSQPTVKTFVGRTSEMLRYLDIELSRSPYFVGNSFTAADLMMNFPFGVLTKFIQYDLSPYPNIVAHLAAIAKRPAYQKAMEVADPPA
jgi:glutathione S-transferase